MDTAQVLDQMQTQLAAQAERLAELTACLRSLEERLTTLESWSGTMPWSYGEGGLPRPN